jgi:cellulose 1,4-beta-cellobiosidase
MLRGVAFTSVSAVLAKNASSGAENPFAGKTWYVNPANMEEYDTSIATASGTAKQNLQGMKNVPSAYWIDVKSKIDDSSLRGMRGILADAASHATPPLVVLMHYDVPNRDCKAFASNGEICCTYKSDGRCDYTAAGDCTEGINEYKTQYVDPFVKALKDYPTVPVVVIVEPDSLPNLATNLDNPKCGNTATKNAYKTGIGYALQQLQTTHATIYIDAAHGGWLGWDDNLKDFLELFKDMGVGMSGVRGFAQNVANYQPIGSMCEWEGGQGTKMERNNHCLPSGSGAGDECCHDPCKLGSQWNGAVNEMNFAQSLVKGSEFVLDWSPVNIIDTSRNGVDNGRQDCANWCNPRDMGAGAIPTTSTGNSLVDAFFWLKTPGESDGCTQELPDGTQCPRYDTMCGSSDSIGSQSSEPKAPEAGQWFDFQVKQLAENAADTNWPAPVPTPSPRPTPVVPTPGPRPTPGPSDCPGGSLSACLEICPRDPTAVYQACVQTCLARCPGRRHAEPSMMV